MNDTIPNRPTHEEKLGTLLWRTLDRLERSLADRTIDAAQAREIIDLVAELTQAMPESGTRLGSRLAQARSSWIQPRTLGSNA